MIIPLAAATLSTQASIVVLAPIVVEVANAFGVSVSAAGQARAVLAGTAVIGSLSIGSLIDRIGVRPLLITGSLLSLSGAVITSLAPTITLFYFAQIPAGLGVACMLSGGFAGVGVYFEDRDVPWAMGYVVGLQSLAWIVGNPVIGLLTDAGSWRLAYLVPAVVSLIALAATLDHAAAAAHPPPGRRLIPRWAPAGVPRPLCAPLDDLRADGLCRVDRRAHLRRAPSTWRPTACPRPRWASCSRCPRPCSSCRARGWPAWPNRIGQKQVVILGGAGNGGGDARALQRDPVDLVHAAGVLPRGGIRRAAAHRLEHPGARPAADAARGDDVGADGKRAARLHDRLAGGWLRAGRRGFPALGVFLFIGLCWPRCWCWA